ncbi:MAG: endo-1,4-beta-xylanase [Acidobacteria bacterium]|nr:endo-1,4-beta-xylanase [Acidobacteriota bacterium]
MRPGLRVICGWMAALCAFGQLTPRAGWTTVSGAEDLVQAGSWGCVSGVSVSDGAIVVAGTTGYTTVLNTAGPILKVSGDFSIMARVSAVGSTGVFLSLVGSLNKGLWWQGLQRLDVGYAGATVQTNYWTGSSSNSTSRTLGRLPSADPLTLEVARSGSQIQVFINGSQLSAFNDPGLFAAGSVYLGFNVAPGATLRVSALSAAVPTSGAGGASVFVPWRQTVARSGTGLRDVADQAGFSVGAALDPILLGNSSLSAVLGREFNMLVAGSVMGMPELEPAPGQYSYCGSDELVAFAATNGMKVRGHTLVWHQDVPAWLSSGGYSASLAQNYLKDFIYTVVGHFKGQVHVWDVVNEAISYSAPYGPQPSYWLTQFGGLNAYIDASFRWARDADPTAKLYYNDTGGEGLGGKSDVIYALVSGMISRGVPIDGVGLEMHVAWDNAPKVSDVAANMARYARLGLEVQITEMDVRVPDSPTAAQLKAQSDIYGNMLAVCMAAPNCTAFLTWGVGDADSWIPASFPGYGSALLFDYQYQPKAVYSAVASALSAAATKPRIFWGGVTIHGGVSGTVSPGSLADIYGANLTAGTASLDGVVSALPRAMAGTQVLVNGAAAPLVYVSPSQAIFQVPYETSVGTASVAVTSVTGATQTASMTVRSAAPSLLTYGANRAVVVNQDGAVNSATACATPGTTAVAYLIGSGPLDNAIATGGLAPLSPLSRETLPVSVTLDGVASPSVAFAGMTPGFAGLVQVNFVVPAAGVGDHALQVTIGTAQSNQPAMCVGR